MDTSTLADKCERFAAKLGSYNFRIQRKGINIPAILHWHIEAGDYGYSGYIQASSTSLDTALDLFYAKLEEKIMSDIENHRESSKQKAELLDTLLKEIRNE